MAASECIFCKIAAGTAECQELYRGETTLAFMDIHPANEGHCLVIPQAHFATVFEMSPESFAAVGATVAKLARAVNETLQPDGLSLVQANGEVAGQTVRHVHVHVLPRRAGDNLLLNWDRGPCACRSRSSRCSRQAHPRAAGACRQGDRVKTYPRQSAQRSARGLA